MNKQPDALHLAAQLDPVHSVSTPLMDLHRNAAAELRRLHAEVERLNLYAAGADQLVEVWKGRAQDFMNSRDRLLKANRTLWAKLDRLQAEVGQPPALEQPQVQASAIPAGWKLVPSDATHQWAENLADRGMRISSLASAISDMLAAAPQPPTTEQSSVVHTTQVEQEPVALLADAIRAEPTELIHKWRVLELIQDHARQQPKREPLLPKS